MMNQDDNVIQLAQANQAKAKDIIQSSGLIPAWKAIGAEVHLVGSLRMGLLLKHRDIDFHVYTHELNLLESFRAMATLATHPSIRRIEYANHINTDEHCIEWHAWYQHANDENWQLDMIHILKGTTYEGYFERVADRIKAILTPETKRAILSLKNVTPELEHIPGIEYYQAVLRDGIRTWSDFQTWRKIHSQNGIVDWIP